MNDVLSPSTGSVSFDSLKLLEEFKNPSAGRSQYPALAGIPQPHLDSFNSLLSFGDGPGILELGLRDLGKFRLVLNKDDEKNSSPVVFEYWLSDVSISKPYLDVGHGKSIAKVPLLPRECRERGITYKGNIQARLNWRINDGEQISEIRNFGLLPVMVRSSRCNLESESPRELMSHGEDSEEFGGYFLCNGIERLIRLLIVPKRNYPIAILRPSFQKRGTGYSHYGVSIRCVREDQTSMSITLHYLNDGRVNLRLHIRKIEYIIPVVLILRALCDTTDKHLYDLLMAAPYTNEITAFSVETLINQIKDRCARTRDQCLEYMGRSFAAVMNSKDGLAHKEVGELFLKQMILVHLDNNEDKFKLLIFMIQKLLAVASEKSMPDNPDLLQFQEVLLPGHLLSAIIKEGFENYLSLIATNIKQDYEKSPLSVNLHDRKYLSKFLVRIRYAADIGKKVEYFLSTGNVLSRTGMDLQQASGFTVVAERLNFYRYLSHFRSIHRGSFFMELKTTSIRRLYPESWGFICPVHTPDGSPCGLLNHLSHSCFVVTEKLNTSTIPELLISLGVSEMPFSVQASEHAPDSENELVAVQLEGKIIGWCTFELAKKIAEVLRYYKVTQKYDIPLSLEIGLVPVQPKSQYPGLYLFSGPARMTRPTIYLKTNSNDSIGPFEQVYMNIACTKNDIDPKATTHIEQDPTNVLSIVANLTPFSDFNQSPRNMYQCQMCKQTMGTPAHNLFTRTDNKMYLLHTGQAPIIRTKLHNEYNFDSYPNGINAVVCVISYTGYDMEDGLVINKSSINRGMSYGSIYKSEFVDLSSMSNTDECQLRFGFIQEDGSMNISKGMRNIIRDYLDDDGLPKVGSRLELGSPMYAYIDKISGKTTIQRYKSSETAYVHEVRVLATDNDKGFIERINIKLRIPRGATVGDKFSSRHGQKGVISQVWDAVDMPFTESGIIPDIIINPHAFPSRMTIGMFVESLAGKYGALSGKPEDASTWRFMNKSENAADYLGKKLLKSGFNYHGSEIMFSGITGEEFNASIYIGVIYYQRLRHMVSDKYQVRISGPVHDLTRQPVKGRKRAGGIRFGEMERDSLLAHGTSFLLQDRLLDCSDRSFSPLCRKCGSILSLIRLSTKDEVESHLKNNSVKCMNCADGGQIVAVVFPYVFRYFCSELAAMHVKVTIDTD